MRGATQRNLQICAGVMLLLGGTWILQGASVLNASPMTGNSFWMGPGTVLVLAGIAVAIAARKAR